MERITKNNIESLMYTINKEFQLRGFKQKIVPYFCYGAYGANLQKDGESGVSTLIGLGTKRELYNALYAYFLGLTERGNK